MQSPIVSIGLPVYNGERYVREAVDSILAQDFQDFELIISDNGSTDATRAICERYASADKRVVFHSVAQNRGAGWNFERVFQLARGRYFQWACHDDVWAPTLLRRCVEILDRHDEVVLCYTQAAYIDADSRRIDKRIVRPDYRNAEPNRRFRALLLYHFHPNECSQVLGLMRSSVLRATGRIGNYLASDMVLLGELAMHGRFHEIDAPLFLRRDHPGTSTKANRTNQERAVWYDPAQKGRAQFPAWRWLLEWARAIRRSPIGPYERSRCMAALLRWAWWNREGLVQNLVYGNRRPSAR